MLTRRELLKAGAVATGAIVAAPLLNIGRFHLFGQGYSKRVVRLVRESVVIDMLNPFKMWGFKRNGEMLIQLWLRKPDSFTEADAQRYRDSGITVFAYGAGAGTINTFEDGVRWFGNWNNFIAGNDQWLSRIDSSDDFERAKASNRIGLLHSTQHVMHFRTEADVDVFHGLGQRVAQLTYNTANQLGDGALEKRNAGLTAFGVRVVARMNAVGMAVDVSHCGDRTTLDAIDVSTRPVLITHANCRALIPHHPRAKTNEMIQKMAQSGGVMGITFIRFLVRDQDPTTLEHVLDHFDHVARLVGVEHVGIGSDYDLDGLDSAPEERDRLHARIDPRYGARGRDQIDGINHPKRVYDLTEGLIRRRYNDADIRLILGGNFQRVLGDIWKVQGPAR